MARNVRLLYPSFSILLNVKFLFSFILFSVSLLWAGSVVDDSQTRFVYSDEVRDTSTYLCDKGGVRLIPERMSLVENSDLPYREYRVAVPSNARPSVSVKDTKTEILTIDWCREDTLISKGTVISSPILRDGLWVVDIRIPLLLKSGSRWVLRKNFELQVNFSGSPQGKNPGKRILASVMNPKAAARFGTNEGNVARVMRKASSSDLSQMTWLARLLVGDRDNGGISEDGMYAVSFKTIRSAMQEQGRQNELDGIDVDKIRLYGASPDTLSDVFHSSAEIIPAQLFEIPIEVRDHNGSDSQGNGIFDNGDSIIFVGYGTSLWKRIDFENNTSTMGEMDYYYSSSPYSFYQYFQLGWNSSGKGKRLTMGTRPSGTAAEINWLRYLRVEKDVLLRDTYFLEDGGSWDESTGKEWFWFWKAPTDSTEIPANSLYSEETSNLLGRVNGGREYVSFSYMPRRSRETLTQSYETRMEGIKFSATVNGKTFTSYDRLIPGGNFQISNPGLKNSGNTYSLKMLPNGNFFDRFDGMSVAYQWTPSLSDSAEWLLPGRVARLIRIPVGTSSDLRVLKFKNFEPIGLLPVVNGVAIDSVDPAADYRYLLYRTEKWKSVASIEGIPNKVSGVLTDIARISSKTEYVIVAPEAFQAPAVELANFRSGGEAVTKFNTAVVLAEDIYRAYNGGVMNPVAIRNYLAYVRSVCPDFRYVLLAGNGHFDYRGFHSGYKPNRLPPFEKEDAASDDFFAALDSGEAILYGTYDMDVGVGRLPISSVADFQAYNEKAMAHEKLGTMDNGEWRNTLLFTADDAWTGFYIDGMGHSQQQENMSRMLYNFAATDNYRFDMEKVFLLNYTADASGQKLDAATDLINQMNQGALFTLYFGHGSPTAWAYEGLLKASYISDISNEGRYTILCSFSCSVGRFDKGDAVSLSETFIQAKNKGAIVSIGATRETYSGGNGRLANSLLSYALFTDGNTIGNAFRYAKGITKTSYSFDRYIYERYVLLGEPVISLPRMHLGITLDQQVDTIQALDNMKLSGTVSGMDNGKVRLSILEGSYEKNLSQAPSNDTDLVVLYDGNLIFSEDVDVKDGHFSTEFITPRKIAFGDTAAEIRLWAYGDGIAPIGRGLVSGITIAGTSSYADSLHDVTPPTIQIQSCLSPSSGTSFSDGEHVKLASPACLQIVLEDSTSLDFREEADEGITFELVGVEEPFHPWPFLEQGSRSATVRMTFAASKYPTGTYQFKARAMDILGNESTKSVYVEITDALSTGLMDVFNAPNPMGRKGTTFYFKNLAVNRTSTVSIRIYNQNGRLVQRINNAKSGVTRWDGRDFYGRKLANGLYHYVVTSEVEADDTAKRQVFSKKQKLVISR